MLETCQSPSERWMGVNQIISGWLVERQELITRFFDLSGLRPFGSHKLPTTTQLETFCEWLVDYVSAGHFEVYEQLLQEARDFADDSIDLADRIYPRIAATTRAALEFNDRFGHSADCRALLDELPGALSKLGETLEERFELEDLLIDTLHVAHREQLA